MEIIEDKEFRDKLISNMAAREFSERTGTHSSDLIFCLNKTALRKILNPEPAAHEILLFSVGWATQRWLSGGVEEKGIEVDGITVTPDVDVIDWDGVAIGIAPWEGLPWELKTTFQSSNKPISENAHWLRQLMAQCHVLGVTTAYLTRFELMGDWSWVYKRKGVTPTEHPQLHAYRVEFTAEEIAANWQWMRTRKEAFERLLRTNVSVNPKDISKAVLLPPQHALAPNQSWECTYCLYADECLRRKEEK